MTMDMYEFRNARSTPAVLGAKDVVEMEREVEGWEDLSKYWEGSLGC